MSVAMKKVVCRPNSFSTSHTGVCPTSLYCSYRRVTVSNKTFGNTKATLMSPWPYKLCSTKHHICLHFTYVAKIFCYFCTVHKSIKNRYHFWQQEIFLYLVHSLQYGFFINNFITIHSPVTSVSHSVLSDLCLDTALMHSFECLLNSVLNLIASTTFGHSQKHTYHASFRLAFLDTRYNHFHAQNNVH